MVDSTIWIRWIRHSVGTLLLNSFNWISPFGEISSQFAIFAKFVEFATWLVPFSWPHSPEFRSVAKYCQICRFRYCLHFWTCLEISVDFLMNYRYSYHCKSSYTGKCPLKWPWNPGYYGQIKIRNSPQAPLFPFSYPPPPPKKKKKSGGRGWLQRQERWSIMLLVFITHHYV